MSDSRSDTLFWVKQVEFLINKALRLDEATLSSLEKLNGKTIAFELIQTNLTLFLFPSRAGLMIKTYHCDKPDVLIKGSVINFIMLFIAGRQATNSISADLQVIGDITLAQRFQQVMQSIDPDLEEPLARLLGDASAYQIGRFVKSTKDHLFNASKAFATSLSEYVRFENQLLPDDLMVNDFCREVDELRDDVDRFAEKLKKMKDTMHSS